ncbi:hypothetical protein CLOSTASPAR_02296 [[Clostridium] asparagiforme DSM 15981]|uniref:Uncharacterized protein n=1 Tax=[Clostridium] asparagiforme DSM 15981 TaxID=518636 RepID=C0CZ71_9FIRM|nr:hypothetical protein CLOSTASPAR_02296 [[Clostridium] asparagiforme DSM 15981]
MTPILIVVVISFPHSFSFGKIPHCHIVNITPINISFIPAQQNE